MKTFDMMQMDDAISHAMAGGQSLHLHRIAGPRAPRVFLQAIRAGEFIAHLFDQDRERLIASAREFGVRVVVVERAGTPKQHIDLCGKPLEKARAAFAAAEAS